MSGEGASTRARAARRASPPDRVAGRFVAGQAELLQQIAGAVAVGVGFGDQPGLDIGEGGGEAGQIGFLRQIADGGAGLGEAAAGIRLHQAGGDAQQGGFARAVAPDQAHPVAGRDGQSGAGQQRRGAEAEADILEQEQGWRHGRQCLMFG